jgi:hypothetical protein
LALRSDADLYAYYDTRLARVGKTKGAKDDRSGKVHQTKGWHGTGQFPAENIYLDKQDGFMWALTD